jgi:long-chain acyl-CoA synthetase
LLTVFATVSAALAAHAASRPGAPALTAGDDGLTYAELLREAQGLGRRMARVGVGPGDRVAIAGRNSIEWVLAFLGCLDMGAVAVPLNHRLSAREIGELIAHVEPALVLADEDVASIVGGRSDVSPIAGGRSDVSPIAGGRSDVSPIAGGRSDVSPAGGAPVRALRRGERSIWHEPELRHDAPPPPPESTALIAFTSGSTGTPKGAVISHGALAHAARAGALAVGTRASDRTLVMVPLFHNTGFADQLAQMLMVGGAVDLLPAFGVAAAREALLRRAATYLIAVPGILRLLAEHEDADAMLGACRIACYGGSPMPEAWIRDLSARWKQLGLFNVYGLTEFTSVSHVLGPEELAGHGDSVGRPVEGAEQRVARPDGTPLPAGEAGAILVTGPSRMDAYWRAPVRTREALRGRWLVTGDIGSVDEDGFLRLVGRASEIINRGGEKISPAQVEAAVSLEPDVAEAGVVGAPHPIFGERVVAFVRLKHAGGFDDDAVRDRLRARVAEYAVPERFFVVDDLPRTAAGKVDRRELRRHAAAAYGEGAAS